MTETPITEAEPGGGGSNRDEAEAKAIRLLYLAIVELLRMIGGGNNGGSYTADMALTQFVRHCSATGVKLSGALDVIASVLRDRAFQQEENQDLDAMELERKELELLKSGYKLTIERLASDGFARARQSRRHSDFREQFDRLALEFERRSRRYGWSYMDRLSKALDAEPAKRSRRKKATKASDGEIR